MGNNKAGLVVAIVFSAVGLGLLTLGGFFYLETTKLIDTGIRTKGEVIENVENRDSDGSTYAPKVEFMTEKKERITFTSSLSSYPPQYEVGEMVDVLYPPLSPQSAEVDSWMTLWFGPLICGILGGVFSAVGLGLLVSMVKRMILVNKLKTSGQRIQAKLVRVIPVPMKNGMHYKILAEAQGPDGMIQQFYSDELDFDPTTWVKSPEIDVLVDPLDWKKNYVDLSRLSKPL
jgi:hypothetical protein